MSPPQSSSFFSETTEIFIATCYPIASLIWSDRCDKRRDLNGPIFIMYGIIGLILFLTAATEIIYVFRDAPRYPFIGAMSTTIYFLIALKHQALTHHVKREWRLDELYSQEAKTAS